jgi:outer membrane receptor for ferrienterochelin and colicins
MRWLAVAIVSCLALAVGVAGMFAQEERKDDESAKAEAKDEKKAETKDSGESGEETKVDAELEEIVVTATRGPMRTGELPVVVTVVTRRDIESANCPDVGAAIDNIAGVCVSRFGGLGSGSTVQLRGATSRHAVVMIDGRIVNSPSQGFADLSWLPIENVERIEIVRGPYSALYGAGAVGGVVNIITKKAPEEPYLKSSLAFGSFQTSLANIEGGGKIGDFGAIVGLARKESGGHRPHSEYLSELATCNLSYRFSEETLLSLDFNLHEDVLETPGVRPASDPARRWDAQRLLGDDDVSTRFDQESRERTSVNCVFQTHGLKITTSMDRWRDKSDTMNVGYRNWWTETFLAAGCSDFHTDVLGMDVQYRHELGSRHLLTVGSSFKKDDFDVEDLGLDTDPITFDDFVIFRDWAAHRKTWSFFAQDEIDIDPVVVTVGGRWDHPSDFPSKFTLRTGAIWKCTDRVSLRGGFGTSYSAPSLNDLYWPRTAWAIGNPDVGPETGKSFEIGVDHAFDKRTLWRLTVFSQRTKDMIGWAPTGPAGAFGNLWQPDNIGRVRIDGVETSFTFPMSNSVDGSVGYTYVDAGQTSREVWPGNLVVVKKRRLRAVPQHKLDVGANCRGLFGVEPLNLAMNAAAVSQRYMYYNTAPYTRRKRIPGYCVVDAKVSYDCPWGNVFLSLDNFFDKGYTIQSGMDFYDRDYPMPGRTIMLGFEIELGKSGAATDEPGREQ